MFFALSPMFLVLALVTGAHVYVLKNTLSHWLASLLSAVASTMAAWTAIYYAARSFFDPARVTLETFAGSISLAFPNHAPTEPLVFGNIWLLACVLPMVVGCFATRELRKIPDLAKEPPIALAIE